MKLFPKRKSKSVGLSPGSLVYTGEQKIEQTRIFLIDYDAETTEEKELQSVEDALAYKEEPTVTWINVDGLHETDVIRHLGEHFGIHRLVLEDILNVHHRPKLEDHESYVFVTLKMLQFDKEKKRVESEQVSLILGSGYVLSFQERSGDVFQLVRERIRENKKRIHNSQADYLLYSLVDAVVDHYYLVLEQMGECIEQLEEDVTANPSEPLLQQINMLKHDLVAIRQAVWPIREIVNALAREESPLIQPSTHIYLRDVYDHVVQVMETIEGFRDMVSGLLDVYRSTIDRKTNEVMKVLTIIATIFIPLTFIAGIYGMNFNPESSPWNMPELNWEFGYPVMLLIMLGVVVGMVIYFKRKKWL